MLSESTASLIGHIESTSAPIEVKDLEGNIKSLTPGDPIHIGDIIINTNSSDIVIALINGQLSHIINESQFQISHELLKTTEIEESKNRLGRDRSRKQCLCAGGDGGGFSQCDIYRR